MNCPERTWLINEDGRDEHCDSHQRGFLSLSLFCKLSISLARGSRELSARVGLASESPYGVREIAPGSLQPGETKQGEIAQPRVACLCGEQFQNARLTVGIAHLPIGGVGTRDDILVGKSSCEAGFAGKSHGASPID